MFLCSVAQTSAAAKMIRFHCVRFIKVRVFSRWAR